MGFTDKHNGAAQPLSNKTVSNARHAFFIETFDGSMLMNEARMRRDNPEVVDLYHPSGRVNQYQHYASILRTMAQAAHDGMNEEARVVHEQSEKFAALIEARADATGTCPISIVADGKLSEEERALGFQEISGKKDAVALLSNLETLLQLMNPMETALEQTQPILKARGAMARMAELLERIDREYPETSEGRSTSTALQRGAKDPLTVALLQKELKQFERNVMDQSYIGYRFLEEMTPEKLDALEKKYANRPMTLNEAFSYRDQFVRDFQSRMEGVSHFIKQELIKPELKMHKTNERY